MLEPEQIVFGLMWYVVFLFSTVCHEAAHAWAALQGGDRTAYYSGQVSLSPFPHIQREPFGMMIWPWLTFFLNGWMMGWASAPYDPFWARRYPKRAAWMSLAGPAANFTLAIVGGLLLRAGHSAGVFQGTTGFLTTSGNPLEDMFKIMFFLNVVLGAFNLIPIPPLDGFTAIGVVLPEQMAYKLEEWRQTAGMFQIVGLLIAWKVAGYVIGPVMAVMSILIFGT
ncbi:MAG: site-2 protease family protein [Acidobacteria bacterium]|nr:site-2 protease family protein [Acidobacteriota bacterium]